MKKILFLFVFVSVSAFCQTSDTNIHKGFIAKGYDVVSYFQNKPQKGKNDFIFENDGIRFKFSTQENLNLFKANPKKYIPQYGGYCAYAIGLNGKKVDINPKTFEIRDGKLYLFYNAWGTNTLNLWIKEGAEKLQKQADKNWQKIIKK